MKELSDEHEIEEVKKAPFINEQWSAHGTNVICNGYEYMCGFSVIKCHNPEERAQFIADAVNEKIERLKRRDKQRNITGE